MRDSTSGSDTAFAFLGSGRDAQNVETARTASSTCVPVFGTDHHDVGDNPQSRSRWVDGNVDSA